MTDEETIRAFYRAFAAGDHLTMAMLYSDSAVFTDPVFPFLDSTRTRSMWQMFCSREEQVAITVLKITSTPSNVHAIWEARYAFGSSRRLVVNRIQSEFTVQNGLIIRQRDYFSFYKWARMALGPTGWLMGWTPIVQNAVKAKAHQALEKFIKSKPI